MLQVFTTVWSALVYQPPAQPLDVDRFHLKPTYWCANCLYMVHLDNHGRCEQCASDAVLFM